jgi:coatomer subunit beta'
MCVADGYAIRNREMYLLGYLAAHNKVYVCDKDVNVYGCGLSLSVIEYQSAILRGDLDTANELLPSVPADQRNRIARFLEGQGECEKNT